MYRSTSCLTSFELVDLVNLISFPSLFYSQYQTSKTEDKSCTVIFQYYLYLYLYVYCRVFAELKGSYYGYLNNWKNDVTGIYKCNELISNQLIWKCFRCPTVRWLGATTPIAPSSGTTSGASGWLRNPRASGIAPNVRRCSRRRNDEKINQKIRIRDEKESATKVTFKWRFYNVLMTF